MKEALRLEWVKLKDICSEDIARGGLPIPANVDQVDRAKKAFNDFEQNWKGDHQDKGKKMVDTAAAFFEADNAVKSCEERRAKHVEASQATHAVAVLMFQELEDLVGKRREAREKANEAHSYQSADEGDDETRGKMLAQLEKGGFFSADQIEVLRLRKPILPTTQFSPTPTANSFFNSCRNSRSRRRTRRRGTSTRCSHRRQMTTPSSTSRLNSRPRPSPICGSRHRQRCKKLRSVFKPPPRSLRPVRSSTPIDLSGIQRAFARQQKQLPKKTAQGKCRLKREPKHRKAATPRMTLLLRHLEHASHSLRDPCQTRRTIPERVQPSTSPKARKPPAVHALRMKAREVTRLQQESVYQIYPPFL